MDKVVDSLGLCLEGEHLTTFIPATSKAFVFRVKSRVNRGYEKFYYGPLPLPSGLPLPSYVGGAIPVPATGVMPGTTYIPAGAGLSFPMTGVFDDRHVVYA